LEREIEDLKNQIKQQNQLIESQNKEIQSLKDSIQNKNVEFVKDLTSKSLAIDALKSQVEVL